MKRGKPVNVRSGRTTVVTLPSGDVVALKQVRERGHLVLRITAPPGSRIETSEGENDRAQAADVVGAPAGRC